MNNTPRKIVVLTPVKDEEWILERFLWACSRFADHILVLDQQSQDRSVEICASFNKVTVIANPSLTYDELSRSKLLVDHARRLFGEGNLLVGFDADELPAFAGLDRRLWEDFLKLPTGTNICFEKPEILDLPPRCVRTTARYTYGFIDDGSPMEGRLIHSRRTPGKPSNLHHISSEVVLLHFARVRWMEYCIRQAVYGMIENVNCSKSLRVRNCYYSPLAFTRFGNGTAIPIPQEWLNGYREHGIDLMSYRTKRFNSFHLRGLRLMGEHGQKRFGYDDIWWEDWEAARVYFLGIGESGLPTSPISPPSALTTLAVRISIKLYFTASRVAGWVRSFKQQSPHNFGNFGD